MTASLESFVNTIKDRNHEELLTIILELKAASLQDAAIIAEFRRSSTEMSKEYCRMKTELEAIRTEQKELQKKYNHVCEENASLTRLRFGRQSEKLSSLINISPAENTDPLAESSVPDRADTLDSQESAGMKAVLSRPKQHYNKTVGKRVRDLSGLPCVNVFDLDVEKLDAEYGEGGWRIYNWHTHTTVERIPAVLYRKVSHTPVLSVGLEHQLVSIPAENVLLKYSLVSCSLAASIIYYKFCLGLPLYRQETDLIQMCFPLSRQTMSSWVLRFAFDVFGPVYDCLCEELLVVPYNQCDETTVSVIHDDRSAGTKSYMWVHITSELAQCHPVVVFCYEKTRSAIHLREFYADYSGYVTCDAYQAYQTLEKETNGRVTISGCMMHARRRYAEALALIDLKKIPAEKVEELPEIQVLKLIGDIYDADGALKELTVPERTKRRDSEVRPKVDAYFEYVNALDIEDPLISEKLKDAISYSRNQEIYLRRFLEDGNIPIDDGATERCIRPFAVGRFQLISIPRHQLFDAYIITVDSCRYKKTSIMKRK